ncbi:MAG: periplasmic heavy metal sensor [Planctomycetota bacterium]|jgi:Spy/CpxP family protein refolding chaperone
MKRQLTWLALAISVLFNLFFLTGYLQARWQRGSATPAPQTTVADELSLDSEQAAIFGHLRDGLREDNRVFTERLALVQQELFSELVEPQPDPERMAALIDQDGELRRQMHHSAQERFRAFIGMLSPEQRQQLSRHLDRGRHRGQRHRMLLRRFDRDHDGRLDEAEEAAAKAFMEQRQSERMQRRERMLERFDVNDDGTIDESERATMREWFETERRGTNGGRRGSENEL